MRKADCYEFITTGRLAIDSASLIGQLPSGIDTVVGVARSGLVPAALIADYLHAPLYVASREHVAPAGAGFRLMGSPLDGKHGHVLLVDDSACSGRQSREVRVWVQAAFPRARLYTAAIYATPAAIPDFDFVAVELDSPHYLEWNYFNCPLIDKAALDFDGILCPDVPAEDDDDGFRYFQCLLNMPPRYLPRRSAVSAIVTARLEKYRPISEAWLKKWGVRWERLIMGPWKTQAERVGQIAKWKAGVYASLPNSMFVESNRGQAIAICELTGKPVLCPAAGRVMIAHRRAADEKGEVTQVPLGVRS